MLVLHVHLYFDKMVEVITPFRAILFTCSEVFDMLQISCLTP